MSDFTGFYFGKNTYDIETSHSSYYNLVRVSGGDRYEEYLFPSFKDQTKEVVGGDRTLYDKTNYTERKFDIEMAFDNLKERDFRRMRDWLNPKEIKFLRFDERPYRTFLAKLASAPKIEYICFLENNESHTGKERIYKGELKLEFVAYDPMGYCNDDTTVMTPSGLFLEGSVNYDRYNWQELQTYAASLLYDNVDEWGGSSGLLDSLNGYNEFFENGDRLSAYLYNPGDEPADFELFLDLSSDDSDSTIEEGRLVTIYIYKENFYFPEEPELLGAFKFLIGGLSKKDTIILRTKNHSLTVYHSEWEDNRSLRYDLIKSTHWIKIPQTLDLKEGEKIRMDITSGIKHAAIKYGYKYY